VIREQVRRFCALGPLPAAKPADLRRLKEIEVALQSISAPVSNDEARLLVKQFGPDDCYGMAWTLIHLIETAPGWPIDDCLENLSNEWVRRMKETAERSAR